MLSCNETCNEIVHIYIIYIHSFDFAHSSIWFGLPTHLVSPVHSFGFARPFTGRDATVQNIRATLSMPETRASTSSRVL